MEANLEDVKVGRNQTASKLVCVFLIILSAAVQVKSTQAGKTQRLPTSAEPVIQGPLSLAEAIAIANKGNLDLVMAAHRIESAASAIKKAQAAFYPLVGLSLEYMQGDAPSQYLFKTIDQRKFQPGTDFNQPGWFENWETGAMAELNLFNGNRDRLGLQIAESEKKYRQSARNEIAHGIRTAVIQAWYNILASGDYVDISKESLETIAAQLDIMKVRYRAGGALKSDLLSLEVRLALAKEELVRSRNRLEISKTALAGAMGLDPDVKLELKADTDVPLSIPATYAEGLTLALSVRPEIRKIREKVYQAEKAMSLAKSGYVPKLDFKTRYWMADPNGSFSTSRDNWTAGVVLTWALFSGFSTDAQVKEATAGLNAALAADRKTLLAVKTDVKTAYLRLKEAGERLAVTEKSVESATESFELVRQQYLGGSVGITRYLDSELARNRSRIHTATAYYDKERSRADVCRAIACWEDDVFKRQERVR
ncbi:MAG: TolC family protein [Desulfobacterales bacterium]|nr:TolC family protein [Desulfobacterales bacterium]